MPLGVETRNRPFEIKREWRERRELSSKALRHQWKTLKECLSCEDDSTDQPEWARASLESLERWEAEHGLGQDDDREGVNHRPHSPQKAQEPA